jgi:Flp pilus assembly protein TadG
MRTKNRTLGQSIIEFALIFPFLLFLLLGLFDLGRAVLFMSTLNTAAREGTRWAIVQPRGTTSAAVQAHIRQYFFDIKELSDNSTINPVFYYPSVSTDPEASVTITITYTYLPITPGIKEILGSGSGIPLKAESKMLLAPVAR